MVIGLLTGHKVTVTGLEELIAPSAAEEMTDLTTRTDVADWLTASGIGPADNDKNYDDTRGDEHKTERASCSWLRRWMNVRP